MDLTDIIEALSRPSAYSPAVDAVKVHHTHISVVFLAGNHAYKIKKPLDLGFLDFTTLERRQHYCAEEVRLNRRLAPRVYLGVVAVTRSGKRVAMDGNGEVVEWAVKMQRLPEAATLLSRLERGEVGPGVVEALGRKVARFHVGAEAGPPIAALSRWEAVAANARENFDPRAAQVGTTVCAPVLYRLKLLTERALADLRPLIERRADHGRPRDTHGDLRLDHVYLFPEREPPDDLVIIDCIEFNERFRYADPVADMAFLVMDLTFRGRPDLAGVFGDSYFQAAGDEEGRALLPFYTAYRAMVRAKVDGFELGEKEVPEPERTAALARARAHWLLALGQLEQPGRKPCLVLLGGVPGAGKSTLARGLAEQSGFCLIRSDEVRKELAGDDQGPAAFGEGMYSPEWNERTYAECSRRAAMALFEGKRVLVDAGFRVDRWRRDFLEAATGWGVPAAFLLCQADTATVRARLEARRGDISDADWSVHERIAASWEKPEGRTRHSLHEIPTADGREQALAQAREVLRALQLEP